MRPLLHPTLVNGRSGDPALYIETLFEKRALLFDRLLRLHVGREKRIALFGPAGFVDHVAHKLHGYLWNLAESYACDLVLVVTEIDAALATRTVRFRLQRTFAAEELGRGRLVDG